MSSLRMGTSTAPILSRVTAGSSPLTILPSMVRPSLSSTLSKAGSSSAASSAGAAASRGSIATLPSELFDVLQPGLLEGPPVVVGPVLEGLLVRAVLDLVVVDLGVPVLRVRAHLGRGAGLELVRGLAVFLHLLLGHLGARREQRLQ